MNSKREFASLRRELSGEDGFYIIERGAVAAIGNRFLKKKASRRIRKCISDAIGADLEKDIDATAEKISLENEKRPFSEDELCSIKDAICLHALHILYLSSDRRKHLADAISLIGKSELYDFAKLRRTLSALEAILEDKNPCAYTQSSEETQAAIRRYIQRYAKRHRIPDHDAAIIVCRHPKKIFAPKKTAGIVYYALSWSAAAVLCIFFAMKYTPFCLVAFFPVVSASLFFFSLFFSRIAIKTDMPIPSLSHGNCVPDEARTLCVVTILLSDKKTIVEQTKRLERFYYQNPSDNVCFALLADLPDSASLESAKDDEIIGCALENIRDLGEKLGDHFGIFIRRRSPSLTERSYTGWERKRGALLDLSKYLRAQEDNFREIILPDKFRDESKYILTLDADTNLGMGAVFDFVAAMMHPCNKPIVKGMRVVDGYGVLAPYMMPSLRSATASPFSLLISGAGGIDGYHGAHLDLLQSLFSHSVYCGKGIFDIDTYLLVLDHAFPQGRILSHDLLEGSLLRAGLLSSLSLTDSVPADPDAFFSREHRWIRGDTQAFAFSFPRVKSESGKKRNNPSNLLCRYLLADNLRRALTPVFACASLICALILCADNVKRAPGAIILLALSYILLPPLTSLFTAFRGINRRFYSKVLVNVWHSFSSSIWSIVSLIHSARIALDAAFRSVWRMNISKRKLLEWKTSSALSSGEVTLYSCWRNYFLSLSSGLLLILLAPRGIFTILGLLFFSCPFAVYALSLRFEDEKKEISPKRKDEVTEWVRDTWSFFERFVTEEENYLPPDNYQELPFEAVAHRTSPTNIAMYLLSTLAACDLGFITKDELGKRVDNTLRTLENLPRYKTQFYNWYDTQRLGVLGNPYISSVDSGNLLASLLCLSQGLKEYSLDELSSRAKAIAESMDFSILYNEKRRLFSIGYDTVKDEMSANCYDLLMSESRTLSYTAIALGYVMRDHWGSLGRPVAASCGHIGIASWSGTTFEYFMSALILPTRENSLLYESLGFALVEQQKDRRERIYGRSESAYFAFDEDMNYQYRAFGAETLALDPTVGREEVIAPYSSFLMLPFGGSSLIDNLRRMKEKGLYGRHGFYEACDFTKNRVGKGSAIIYSYMSHHVGMSIVASANYLLDDIFIKRFMRDPRISACDELLEERVPADANLHRLDKRDEKRNRKDKKITLLPTKRSREIAFGNAKYDCALISNGSAKLYFSSFDNRFFFEVGKTAIFPDFSFDNLRSARLFLTLDGKTTDVLSDGFSFDEGSMCALSIKKTQEAVIKSAFSVFASGAAFAISISAKGNFSIASPLFLSEVILCNMRDHRANPLFSPLTISAEYLEAENALLFIRRATKPSERDLYFCASLECSGLFDFCVRRSEHLPYMYSESDLFALAKKPFSNRTYDDTPLEPFCAIKKTSRTNGKYECSFLFCQASDREGVLSLLAKIRREKSSLKCDTAHYFASTLEKSASKTVAGIPCDALTNEYISLLLLCSCIGRGYFSRRRDRTYTKNEIWKYGVSGDHPMLCLVLDENAEDHSNVRELISRFACAQTLLFRKGYSCDLVIVFSERDGYFREREKRISELLPLGKVHSSRGGITLIADSSAKDVFSACANIYCEVGADTVFENIKHSADELFKLLLISPDAQKRSKEYLFDEKCVIREDGVRLEKGKRSRPRSYVYASRSFGTIITADSLGYTYFRNSQRFRLSEYFPDTLLDLCGEGIIAIINAKRYDLCALAKSVSFDRGNALYEGDICGIGYKIEVGCAEKFPVKLVVLSLCNSNCDEISDIEINYEVKASLGGNGTYENISDKCRFYRAIFSEGEDAGDDTASTFGAFLHKSGDIASLEPSQEKSVVFLFGAINYKNDRAYYDMVDRFSSPESIREEFGRCRKTNEEKYGSYHLESGSAALDLYFNYFAPWQADTVRQMARSAFYQSGGAWGFRDQLQDCVCTLPVEKKWAKVTILRACAHQFYQGDVMHWFHHDNCGVRTKCSDDLIFLPWAVCEYLDFTKDDSLLSLPVRYLDAPLLSERESESYGKMSCKTKRKESVLLHCMRALDLAINRVGSNGLSLIGSCDWNDGFSRIGIKGKGESVPLSFFLSMVLYRFAPIARSFGFSEEAEKYESAAASLERAALEAFKDDRFIRAYDDHGNALGCESSKYTGIDLLAQASSVLARSGKEKADIAMTTAISELFERDKNIFALLSPAISDKRVGYIASYLPGLRENGGQYTHAAMWAAMALLSLGRTSEGSEILEKLSPAAYQSSYDGEAYMIAGDVYNLRDYPARCGWSGYTGAAGWFFRAVLEGLLGLKIEGDHFSLHPSLSHNFAFFSLDFSFGGSRFKIKASLEREDRITLDGSACKNVFFQDGKDHEIEIKVKDRARTI